MENVPNMAADLAAATYDVFFAREGGFEPTARLDVEGMRTVLALRSEYGRPQKELGQDQDYIDLTYYHRVRSD